MQALRKFTSNTLNPARARAKVLARENREMRADLVSARRQAGLSQKDVADRMGVSQQAVYKLERYDADPRISTLERYANAVGALIFHRVVIDRGQSVSLAAKSPWAAPVPLTNSVRVLLARPKATTGGWTTAPVTELERVYA